MNEEPINEYKNQPTATKEFLEDILRRGKENIAALKKLQAEIEYDIKHGLINDEDQ